MPTILFLNLKGGVAKTTNVVAVAEALAQQRRVLVIDADHQCTAGELLLGGSRMYSAHKNGKTLYHLLSAMLAKDFVADRLDRFVHPSRSSVVAVRANLHVMPCSYLIDAFHTNMAKGRKGYQSTEHFLRQWAGRRTALKAWLDSEFDYTLVDCPPSLNVQVQFLLRLADGYVVPTVPDRLSVRGALWLEERLDSEPGGRARPLGILWTLFRQQNPTHRKTIQLVRKRIPRFQPLPKPFDTVIPNSAAISSAQEEAETTYPTFKTKYPTPFGALYESLAAELERRVAAQS